MTGIYLRYICETYFFSIYSSFAAYKFYFFSQELCIEKMYCTKFLNFFIMFNPVLQTYLQKNYLSGVVLPECERKKNYIQIHAFNYN